MVKCCRACQEHANQSSTSSTDETPRKPMPVRLVGNGLSGTIPQAAGQKKFWIVAVDYFTKWYLRSLVSDSGTQYSGKNQIMVQRVGDQTVLHLSQQVASKRSNRGHQPKNLQHLKTRLGSAKEDWVDEFLNVLWAYEQCQGEENSLGARYNV
ncbi:UNVERIFIED_CONTAM: hypothetical protein Sangu_1378900 [Sesamum angustifolium]|uniref:Integrase catalytic domain-containing protein n=1 Tax=Sesamum angustifolium TaxID=2727405 RepID=A0AAW2N628_9LAMI